MDSKKLISEINKTCKNYFTESSFYLEQKVGDYFISKGNNISKAINHYNNILEEVSVVKWFSDYWVYLTIKFIGSTTFISLSIFQGELVDNKKNQLFRAEWDDYNNEAENHPQPHWHITSNLAIENTFEEYSQVFEKDDFISTLKQQKSNIVDTNKMHFAMCGNWINGDSHVHSLDDEEKIIKWFEGLFLHIKTQLEYISN